MTAAQEKLRLLEKKLDKAAAKNVIHKNKAARKNLQNDEEIQTKLRRNNLTRPHMCISSMHTKNKNEGFRVSPFVFFLAFYQM